MAKCAARRAGVTRVADITAFAIPGIPVFQATRPATRSLSVSQGKGLTATAAIIGALLEACELWTAENLPEPAVRRSLVALDESDIAAWSGSRDALAVDLDRETPRAWVQGEDLCTGRACAIPWDLLSLNCAADLFEYPRTSVGLACGNTRTEAIVSGLGEVLEHHSAAQFERLAPHEKLAGQIALATIDDPLIRSLLGRIEGAGFTVRAWSMASVGGYPAIKCGLLRTDLGLDDLAPVGGSGCHPSARVAFLRALLEAVQTRAGIVAGARDDLTPQEYDSGGKREVAMVFGSLAFGDGLLDWQAVPTADCHTSEHCVDFLLEKVCEQNSAPVTVFDHEPPWPGLHLSHVLAPGLLGPSRSRPRRRQAAGLPQVPITAIFAKSRPVGHAIRPVATSCRRLLFAGPSIAGLTIPPGVELHPPAQCGDFAALLDDPPQVVGLVDGYFRIAPTVWHKEILSLLARGTRVIGGASLGALRAAELEAFGMEGVGAIFHAYRSGLLVRDDAVMLVHAPAELGFTPLSVPLVDAEHALSLVELPAPARRMMQRIVRRAPYETRTWPDCLQQYRERTGQPFPLSIEALEAAPSLKQRDAALVIDALASHAPGSRIDPIEAPPLTSHYRALLARTARASAAPPA